MENGEQTADNQAVSMRVLNFPPDRSFGTLYRYVLYEGKSTMRILKEIGPARGTVTVPRTQRLELSLSQDTRDLSPLAALRANDLYGLSLMGCNYVDDNALAWVKHLEGLRRLSLWGTRITDAAMEHLRALQRLEDIDLAQTAIDGRGLSDLSACVRLTRIGLQGTSITDSSLAHLASLPRLRDVNLAFTGITDAALTSVGRITLLRRLDLNGTHISGTGLACLQHLPFLQSLDLDGIPLTDHDLMQVVGPASLQRLVMGNACVVGDGWRWLITLPSLEGLFLFNSSFR